jgi:hypothetical protein
MCATISGKVPCYAISRCKDGEGEFLTILGERIRKNNAVCDRGRASESPTSGELWMGGERIDRLRPLRDSKYRISALRCFLHLSGWNRTWAMACRLRETASVGNRYTRGTALAQVKMTAHAKG